jgi:hypothetical protein
MDITVIERKKNYCKLTFAFAIGHKIQLDAVMKC